MPELKSELTPIANSFAQLVDCIESRQKVEDEETRHRLWVESHQLARSILLLGSQSESELTRSFQNLRHARHPLTRAVFDQFDLTHIKPAGKELRVFLGIGPNEPIVLPPKPSAR